MKIYTRTGDRGETSLFGGQRVPKDHLRVEAYGTVDELNACLGWARTLLPPGEVADVVEAVQNDLFTLGADLATPEEGAEVPRVPAAWVERLEGWIDRAQERVPPLRSFVLPGGAPAAAALHLARTVCRRAERRVVALARTEPVNPELIRYLNRLSDLLFVLARQANREAGVPEPPWRPPEEEEG